MVRGDVLSSYATAFDESRAAGQIGWLSCSERIAADEALVEVTSKMFPEGMRLLSETLNEARVGNPRLEVYGESPRLVPDGRQAVTVAQVILGLRGFRRGPADGNFDHGTANALGAFQSALGLPATGALNGEVQDLLRNSCLYPSYLAFPIDGEVSRMPSWRVFK
jgi:hypothetical protein